MFRAFVVILLAVFAAPSWSETLFGRVIGVSDGDTITVLDPDHHQHKIRLSGIDAPEKRQAFGARSKENLSRLAFGQDVAVEWHKRDRYKRIVGKVLISGHDLNLEQVRAGMAWHFKRYEAEQSMADRVAYAHAEAEAQAFHRGLWRDPQPIPPWEFRRPSHVAPNNLIRKSSVFP